MAKAKEKSKSRQKAAKIGKQIETNSVEMAHTIWLAGVGAYSLVTGDLGERLIDGALELQGIHVLYGLMIAGAHRLLAYNAVPR